MTLCNPFHHNSQHRCHCRIPLPQSITHAADKAASKMSSSSHKAEKRQQAVDSEEKSYANPLEKSARWMLSARAAALRTGAGIAFGLGNMSSPATPATDEVLWLDTTLGKFKGTKQLRLDIWRPTLHAERNKPGTPASSASLSTANSATTVSSSCSQADSSELLKGASHTTSSTTSSAQSKSKTTTKNTTKPVPEPRDNRPHPAVIVFHGGGFCLGQGTDDARWAAAAMLALDAVVIAVNYRLAPSYPFPSPVEDCADAVLQITQRASYFNIDPNRIIMSGFSAGSTLSLASWVLLQDPHRWGYTSIPPPSAPEAASVVPKIAGFALFYPLLDWTIDRPTKRQTCSRPDLTLPPTLTDFFDASYIHPPRARSERDDPLLSPGLMPDSMLKTLPPLHLCLCEYDMLLAEGKRFAERLENMGKQVDVRVVEQETHAWDKPPPFAPKPTVAVEYTKALEKMSQWLELRTGQQEHVGETVFENIFPLDKKD